MAAKNLPCLSNMLMYIVQYHIPRVLKRTYQLVTTMNLLLLAYLFCIRSDDDEFGVYQLDSKTGDFPDISGYCGQVQFDEIDNDYRSRKVHPDGEATETKSTSSLHNSFDSQDSEGVQQLVKKV